MLLGFEIISDNFGFIMSVVLVIGRVVVVLVFVDVFVVNVGVGGCSVLHVVGALVAMVFIVDLQVFLDQRFIFLQKQSVGQINIHFRVIVELN